MPIVRLRGPLKQLAGDRPEQPIDGSTVAELLAELERAHPAMRGWVLDERGELRQHINVFVNGEMSAQDAEIDADDRVEIIPAISGGGEPRRRGRTASHRSPS